MWKHPPTRRIIHVLLAASALFVAALVIALAQAPPPVNGSTMGPATGISLPTKPWRDAHGYWLTARSTGILDRSEVIITGTVLKDTMRSLPTDVQQHWQRHTVDVRVCSVIKGSLTPSQTVTVCYREPNAGFASFLGSPPIFLSWLDRATYLLFLRCSADGGRYEIMQTDRDPSPLLLASAQDGGPASIPQLQLDGEDAAARLLSTAIAAANAATDDIATPAITVLSHLSGQLQLSDATQALLKILMEGKGDRTVLAIRGLTLGRHVHPQILPKLVELTNSEDAAIAGTAIAGRLRLKDPGAFVAAKQWSQRKSLPSDQVLEISEAVRCLQVDKQTSDTVTGVLLLTSIDSSYIRQTASALLPEISQSVETPQLIALLEHPDTVVQYDAMRALYMVAEGWQNSLVTGYLPPTHQIFIRDRLRYVTQWKAWWQDGGRIELPRDKQGRPIPVRSRAIDPSRLPPPGMPGAVAP